MLLVLGQIQLVINQAGSSLANKTSASGNGNLASYLQDGGAINSAGLRWVLLMLKDKAHSRNRPTATDEQKKSLRYFGCDY